MLFPKKITLAENFSLIYPFKIFIWLTYMNNRWSSIFLLYFFVLSWFAPDRKASLYYWGLEKSKSMHKNQKGMSEESRKLIFQPSPK